MATTPIGPHDLFPAPDRLATVKLTATALEEQQVYGFRNADTRARPFKMLRTQVLKRAEEDKIKLIGITAATPAVGKSFVAANLAAALSRIADISVCLVDLDLHRPALASRYGIEDGPGIHEFLAGETPDLQKVARRVNEEDLVVVPGFRGDWATGELLASAQGDRLFDGLRALPDSTVVLIDMPPIFADDDAAIIGQRLDAYLLVLEDGRSTKKQALDVRRLLDPTPMLGAVLNKYQSQLFANDYGYGMGYGYGGYY